MNNRFETFKVVQIACSESLELRALIWHPFVSEHPCLVRMIPSWVRVSLGGDVVLAHNRLDAFLLAKYCEIDKNWCVNPNTWQVTSQVTFLVTSPLFVHTIPILLTFVSDPNSCSLFGRFAVHSIGFLPALFPLFCLSSFFV